MSKRLVLGRPEIQLIVSKGHLKSGGSPGICGDQSSSVDSAISNVQKAKYLGQKCSNQNEMGAMFFQNPGNERNMYRLKMRQDQIRQRTFGVKKMQSALWILDSDWPERWCRTTTRQMQIFGWSLSESNLCHQLYVHLSRNAFR